MGQFLFDGLLQLLLVRNAWLVANDRVEELSSAALERFPEEEGLAKFRVSWYMLGKDSAGNPLARDLTAMPHLLIGGTTGSGKSVRHIGGRSG